MSINPTIYARFKDELSSRGWEKHTAACVEHVKARSDDPDRALWSIVMDLRAGFILTEEDLIEHAEGMDY